MRIIVIEGDLLQIRTSQDEGKILDRTAENKLFEFLLARQMNIVTAPRSVHFTTLVKP